MSELWKPHKYQRTALKFIIGRAAAGLFLDPGLGKSSITLAAFDILQQQRMVKGMLVVAPLRPMTEVWPAEIEKWQNFQHLTWHVLHGKGKDAGLLNRGVADVFVINYDGLPWLVSLIESGCLRRLPFNMLVFDESSKLRNTNTQRFKLVRKLIAHFKRRYILTGTPTPKGIMNLFGQVYALDAGERLGRYITHYRTKYFTPTQVWGPYATEWEPKPGAEEQVYDKIKDVVIRFDDSELDMPKRVNRNIYVDLPRNARLIYNDLARDLITKIDANIVYAKNAGVATQKLRQVANGGLYLKEDYDGHGADWKKLHDAKTQAVVDLLEELEGQPALVSYEFHHDRRRLLAALGNNTPWIGGGVSLKRSRELIQEWNRGNLPVLLGQPSSMAHGLNMQSGPGRAVIFHSLIYDYEAYIQFIRRIWRQGQKARRVFVYHIIARNTVDELKVIPSMLTKGATQQRMFDALKEFMKRNRR